MSVLPHWDGRSGTVAGSARRGDPRAAPPAAGPRSSSRFAAAALALAAGVALTAATGLSGVWGSQEAALPWAIPARGALQPRPRLSSARQRRRAARGLPPRLGARVRAAATEAVDVEVLDEPEFSAADFMLPVGPMCPFRSGTMELRSTDQELANIVQEATKWSGEFDQLAASFMSGISPDKAKARRVGTEITQQGQKLKEVLDQLEFSKDFQAVEAYLTLESMANRTTALNFRSVEQLVTWQGQGLLAFAENKPLGPLPTGIDPATIKGASPGANPSGHIRLESGLARVLPFTEEAFDAAGGQEALLLKGEFERLCKEHKQLVGLGETYGDFDPAGKEFYLGQMAQIAFRWEELIDNAQLAGVALNPAFRAMSEEHLRRADLSADGFRALMEDVHDVLRDQANREKGI